MRYEGFDGRKRTLNLAKYTSKRKRKNESGLHKRARKVIHELFNVSYVFEEVALPGSNNEFHNQLYADFFVPKEYLIIEVQGSQHYGYNGHYCKTAVDFVKQQKRDNDKKEWAELNGFVLIELDYNETDDEWRDKINNRR